MVAQLAVAEPNKNLQQLRLKSQFCLNIKADNFSAMLATDRKCKEIDIDS